MRIILKLMLPCLLLSLLITLAACTSGTNDPSVSTDTVSTTDPAIDTLYTDTAATTDAEGSETKTEKMTEPATIAPETEPSDADILKAEPEALTFDASVTVTEAGGKATVNHKDGLTYTATGYDSVTGSKLTFVKGLTLTFDPANTAEAFNRFTLGYTSTQPLNGKITYAVGSKTVTDDFYLEAGENTFSCLIGQYLNGKKGTGITQMTFETCNDKSADFALCVLNTRDYPVYGEGADTYYIENLHYKLGVRLLWGGGINYLEDKTCEIRRLVNLVNQADTGRLIQQSYYGVMENHEYKPGNYNGTPWCYNPVQGGDVKGNHSRIIDIVVTEHSVYVKSQPMDWGHDNKITPSYMENTYTLYNDRVQVDNRFTDFSGWTHRMTSQEVPAFYTVSYLNTFSFYNGTKPWTGDTMSYRDNLNFWGDSAWHGDCTFRLRASNTETWCAWTNAKDDYGIGLYVPGVDSFLAGRHAFNNSKDSNDGATNYVAPVNFIELKSFDALEYSYLITTGSLEDIRATFTTHKDFSDNATLDKNAQDYRVPDNAVITNEFYYGSSDDDSPTEPADKISSNLDLTKKPNAALVISSNNTAVGFNEAESALELTVTGGDPHVTIVYGDILSADTYKTIEITYMLPTTNSQGNGVTDLFLCAGSVTNPDPGACVRMDLIADGEYHTLVVDLSGKAFWSGDIHKIRFDFLDACEAGDVMYVKSIVLK
ncbi:MAG: hypothetical protein IJA91_02790 [Clostridia bacterium]|nr:hypothetical protein [Clostridia bacterium]